MLRQYLKSLADKFREVCPSLVGSTLSAQGFPEAIQYVYDEAFHKGQSSGGGSSEEAFENGKKEIWKGITCEGKREHYANAFQYTDLDYFSPYFDMKPTNAGYMFTQTRSGGVIDFVARFKEYGTTLSFSKSTNMQRAFYVSGATRLGVIDCTATTNLAYLYCSSTFLHTIEKMIVHSGNTYQSSFDACSALEEIRFEGEIGNNIDFSACDNLSHDSLIDIFNHLETKTSGTFTCKIGTANLAKLTDAEKVVVTQSAADGGKGWSLL